MSGVREPYRRCGDRRGGAGRRAHRKAVQGHSTRPVASFAGGRGYSLFLIGNLLGHRDQRSTARYAHLADDIRKSMADDVGEGIREAMELQPNQARAALPLRVVR